MVVDDEFLAVQEQVQVADADVVCDTASLDDERCPSNANTSPDIVPTKTAVQRVLGPPGQYGEERMEN
jgi:hypothetical protein